MIRLVIEYLTIIGSDSMKKILILLIVVLILSSSIQPSMAYTYYTDILGHWSESYIDWATNEVGLFQGYKDNTFKPENNITRAEFMTILSRLIQIQNTDINKAYSRFKLEYSDLEKDFWAYDQIQRIAYYIENQSVKKADIKLIFPGNSFRPNRPITRYEASALISLITPPPIKTVNKNYKDLSDNLRFYKEIMDLTSNHIVKGYEDNTFRPWNNITRAEAAKIIHSAYEELEYLKIDLLGIRELYQFDLLAKKPLFEYGNSTFNQKDLDKKFINAITTLDYISFVGYIPYAERHLYDPNPIDTLWQLKNDDYYNLIGANYYLLYYDKTLVRERQIELIREAFEHYKEIYTLQNIEGMANIINIAKNKMSSKELITFLEESFSFIESNNEKIVVGALLAEEYLSNYQYKKALDIHNSILDLSNDIQLKTHLILNHSYIIYKNSNSEEAIDYLNKSWDSLKLNRQYRTYSNEIDFLFTSIMKQLMIQ